MSSHRTWYSHEQSQNPSPAAYHEGYNAFSCGHGHFLPWFSGRCKTSIPRMFQVSRLSFGRNELSWRFLLYRICWCIYAEGKYVDSVKLVRFMHWSFLLNWSASTCTKVQTEYSPKQQAIASRLARSQHTRVFHGWLRFKSKHMLQHLVPPNVRCCSCTALKFNRAVLLGTFLNVIGSSGKTPRVQFRHHFGSDKKNVYQWQRFNGPGLQTNMGQHELTRKLSISKHQARWWWHLWSF